MGACFLHGVLMTDKRLPISAFILFFCAWQPSRLHKPKEPLMFVKWMLHPTLECKQRALAH